jgi:hypothetical protein
MAALNHLMSLNPTEIASIPSQASLAGFNPRCSDWKLSIDKLSVVRNDPIPGRVSKVCDAIVDRVKNRRWLGSILSSARRFQVQASIPVRGTDQRLLIQAGRKGLSPRDYRIEINPGLLKSTGVESAIDLLDEIFPEGGEDFIRGGVVTRNDLALDLIGLAAHEVVVRSRKQQVHGVFSDRHGVPATHYFGRPKNNNTAVYTKPNKEGLPSLRIERRLIPRCFGRDLQFLPNPFREIQIVHIDAFGPLLNGLNPAHLFDSIRVRGFTHVLKGLPRAQREAFKNVLKDPNNSLLPAMDQIWSQWPEILAASGLGFLLDSETIASPPAAPERTVETVR